MYSVYQLGGGKPPPCPADYRFMFFSRLFSSTRTRLQLFHQNHTQSFHSFLIPLCPCNDIARCSGRQARHDFRPRWRSYATDLVRPWLSPFSAALAIQFESAQEPRFHGLVFVLSPIFDSHECSRASSGRVDVIVTWIIQRSWCATSCTHNLSLGVRAFCLAVGCLHMHELVNPLVAFLYTSSCHPLARARISSRHRDR